MPTYPSQSSASGGVADLVRNYDSFETVPEARAYTDHSDPDIIFVQSLNQFFSFESTSTAADNGTTVLIPDDITPPAPGRWLAVSSATLHSLGGAAHIADTLANLNSKVMGATLDDVGDPRAVKSPPEAKATNAVSRAAMTYADIPGLTVTPGEVSDYIARWSGEVHRTGLAVLGTFQFAVNGVAVPGTAIPERLVTSPRVIGHQARVVVTNAAHAVTVQWKGDSLTRAIEITTRSLILEKARS